MLLGRSLVIASIALTVVAQLALGQADSGAPFVRTLAGLKPDQRIRVTVDGARLAGQFRGVDGDSVTLLRDGVNQRLRLDQLTGVWRRGRATTAGAIVGGVLGTGFGVFVGLVAKAVCECDHADSYPVLLGVAGGAGGAGLGWLVGAAIPRWKRIVP